MPDRKQETIHYALAVLSELLNRFPCHPALREAVETMDLPDDLWMALRVMTMKAPDRESLRNFLLVHQQTGVMRVDGRTLAIVGGDEP